MSLFNVPEAPNYKLSRAPLAQALAQVRFPLIADFEAMSGIAPLQRELRTKFPYMQQEKVQEVSFVAGPAGPSANAAESVNWHFTNDDGDLIVIGAGSATLSVGDHYSGIAVFGEAFAYLLQALEAVGVPRCDRLGVRYLSVAPEPVGEPRKWRDWFRSEFVGWSGSPTVAEGSALMSINQVQLSVAAEMAETEVPAAVQAAVRHGAVPPGTTVPGVPPLTIEEASYLLDIDIFVEGAQKFSHPAIIEQFRYFHSEIDKFFYWSLSDEGGEHFGITVNEN